MNLQRDRRGFIFSLDAALALLVVMIVTAGVARMGGPSLIYGQHGYLRLERYANDALEVMQSMGTLDNIVTFVKHENYENAKNLARAELQKILPAEVQFKLVVGDNRLEIYPSDDAGWASEFSSVEEVAVATRMSTLPPKENFRVLAWLDDENDEDFMDEVEKCTGWEVTRTNNETFFRNQILRWGIDEPYYKTVFIPDAHKNFTGQTESNLVMFSLYYGRLVVGGDTLWYNRYPTYLSTWWFYEVLGVDYRYIRRPPLNSQNTGMHIIDDNHPITTSPYYISYRVDYAGENDNLYVYRSPLLVSGVTTILAEWDNVPPAGGVDLPPWRGIIFRDEYTGGVWQGKGTGVLFNMQLAQSAMGAGVGTSDWVTFARRAIYWEGYPWEFEPVTLYVWRGTAAGGAGT